MKIAAWVIIVLLMVAAIVQHSIYWPQLPDRVASHFGIDGEPDGWMSRTGFTLLMAGVQIGIPVFLAGLGSLISRLPVSMINIPHREYWLGESQRAATLGFMQQMLVWIAVASGLFFLMVSHLIFLANLNGTSLNEGAFFAAMAVYLIIVFGMVGHMIWRFRAPGNIDETRIDGH